MVMLREDLRSQWWTAAVGYFPGFARVGAQAVAGTSAMRLETTLEEPLGSIVTP